MPRYVPAGGVRGFILTGALPWPVHVGRYRRILPALTTNQNAGFVTVPSEKKDKCTYYMSTEIYSKQSCQIKMVCKNNLIGHMIFLTSEKYRMRPVIGHTIFFTSEKKLHRFSRLSARLPKVGMFHNFRCFP